MRIFYGLVSWLCTPLWIIVHAMRCIKGKESVTLWKERWAIGYPLLKKTKTYIWMHGASVGECLAAVNLFKNLYGHTPEKALLLTSHTQTSRHVCQPYLGPHDVHYFAPFDLTFTWRRFFKKWRPACGYIMESDFWPICLHEACRAHISLILCNGRISTRSLQRWRQFGIYTILKTMLQHFRWCFTSCTQNKAVLESMGIQHVAIIPSLKWANAPIACDESLYNTWKQATHNRTIWIASNLHHGEQEFIWQTHQHILSVDARALLIIIPRHTTMTWPYTVDVDANTPQILPQDTTSVYMARFMGHIGLYYRLSPVAWLGGSLIEKGGHNPIEAMQWQCWPLSGSSIFNNQDPWSHLNRITPSSGWDKPDILAKKILSFYSINHPHTINHTLQHICRRQKDHVMAILRNHLKRDQII